MKPILIALISTLLCARFVCAGKKAEEDFHTFSRLISIKDRLSHDGEHSDEEIAQVLENRQRGFAEDMHSIVYNHHEGSPIRSVLVRSIAHILDNSDSIPARVNMPYLRFYKRHFLREFQQFSQPEGDVSFEFDEDARMAMFRQLAMTKSYRLFAIRSDDTRLPLTFTAIAPDSFREFRLMRDISEEAFRRSLLQPMTAVGPLKSGAYFFYTADRQYIIKFIPAVHASVFQQQLPQYFRLMMTERATLLSDILGFYRIKYRQPLSSMGENSEEDGQRVFNLIVVRNTFPPWLDVSEVYDLKGSTLNRNAKTDGAATALKDCDWIRSGHYLALGSSRSDFLAQLAKDTEWLARAKINDYSLLVGIRYLSVQDYERRINQRVLERSYSRSSVQWYAFEGGFVARDQNNIVKLDDKGRVMVYYLSVIDLFTVWDEERQEDHRLKATTTVKRREISNVLPVKYRERFISRIGTWSMRPLKGQSMKLAYPVCFPSDQQ